MLPNRHPMPVRVRPVPFETIQSFATRLGEANFMPERAWRRGLRAVERQASVGGPTLEETLETLGSLDEGHFSRARAALPAHPDGQTCNNCSTGLEGRFACVKCTFGAIASQQAHDGPRVCSRHSRWIGPGTAPDAQVGVDAEVMRADRDYRKLRRAGILDPHRLAELTDCVDEWADHEAPSSPDSAHRFAIAVRIAQQVFRPAEGGSTAKSAQARYDHLTSVVANVVGDDACVTLVDGVWSRLRTAGYANESNHHAFRIFDMLDDAMRKGDSGQLRSCLYPRRRHLHVTQFFASESAGTRSSHVGRTYATHHYVCSEGHRFEARLNDMGKFRKSDGCVYCSRRAALPGFNTLADTHEAVAREWHPSLNKDLQPHHVLSGSGRQVAWLCPEGHSYVQTVAARSRGVGCGYCANWLVDPETNSLAVTHRHLIREWHPSKNKTVTPTDVVAGSATKRWWLCSNGHSFLMPPVVRSRLGAGCPVCQRKVPHPSTSIAVTHPEAAARWHEGKNGDLKIESILAGSARKVWWRCSAGHEWFRTVNQEVLKEGCLSCKVRSVPKGTSMAATDPAMAEQLHPYLNGDITADNVTATTTIYVWWQCEKGHEWRTSPKRRSLGMGHCLICRNRKVAPGENDMATTHPELAEQLHRRLNPGVTANSVVAGTTKKLWWQCEKGHEWSARGNARVRGHGCPTCARFCIPGLNDLVTTRPDIAADFDAKNNPGLNPSTVLASTPKKIWWVCPNGHRTQETGRERTARGGCPDCPRRDEACL